MNGQVDLSAFLMQVFTYAYKCTVHCGIMSCCVYYYSFLSFSVPICDNVHTYAIIYCCYYLLLLLFIVVIILCSIVSVRVRLIVKYLTLDGTLKNLKTLEH